MKNEKGYNIYSSLYILYISLGFNIRGSEMVDNVIVVKPNISYYNGVVRSADTYACCA